MHKRPAANTQAVLTCLSPHHFQPRKPPGVGSPPPPPPPLPSRTRLKALAERCRDGLVWAGCQQCSENLGEQVFDREQTPIRNLAADRDQMEFVGGVEE